MGGPGVGGMAAGPGGFHVTIQAAMAVVLAKRWLYVYISSKDKECGRGKGRD